jgi:hypothetical protein
MNSDTHPKARSPGLTSRWHHTPDGGALTVSPTTFARHAGWLSLAAGVLFLLGQAIWWPFDQTENLATARDPVFHAGSLVYLAGFCVLMFALIAIHGLQASEAGRLGSLAVTVAILGTMLLGGDLWFEAFAVPWLAGGPLPDVLTSEPSTLFALGAIASYLSFAIGWALVGVAGLRARVFPAPICASIVIGGIAGFWALLAPFGIPLGLALAWLGAWILRTERHPSPGSVSPLSGQL